MISTAAVYQRVGQLLKSGTSGYQTADEFNNDMYATFIKILNILCDNYEKNEKVADLLSKEGLVLTTPITTTSSGTFPYPTGHYRSFPIWKVGTTKNYPVTKINANEVAMHETSPIRGANAAKNIYQWYLTNGIGNFLPRVVSDILFTYCVKPTMPMLILTSNDDDYETVSNSTTNIKLPENLFTLFVAEMLSSSSVEQKEVVTQQWAQLDINREKVI